MLLARQFAPWYDERFTGFGRNKIQYIRHLDGMRHRAVLSWWHSVGECQSCLQRPCSRERPLQQPPQFVVQTTLLRKRLQPASHLCLLASRGATSEWSSVPGVYAYTEACALQG